MRLLLWKNSLREINLYNNTSVWRGGGGGGRCIEQFMCVQGVFYIWLQCVTERIKVIIMTLEQLLSKFSLLTNMPYQEHIYFYNICLVYYLYSSRIAEQQSYNYGTLIYTYLTYLYITYIHIIIYHYRYCIYYYLSHSLYFYNLTYIYNLYICIIIYITSFICLCIYLLFLSLSHLHYIYTIYAIYIYYSTLSITILLVLL